MKKVIESMKKLFEGIYSDGKGIYTQSIVPGNRVYGEKIVSEKGAEYREWNPFHSKYCAAIKNGLEKSIFFEGAKVLYLGSAEGTSVSHVSDIVGDRGFVFGVDISETAMQKLIDLSEIRHNIFPIIGDAEQPDEYAPFIEEKVDILFQDVSQRNQAEIFVKNARFLKKGGFGALTLKTKSISQSKKMKDILSEEKKKLAESFEVTQVVSLEPFEASHYLILVKKK